MDFHDEDRPVSILQSLNLQRQCRELCDVILNVSDGCLPAHKCVLSAASEYFKTLFQSGFNDSQASTLTIPDTNIQNLSKVLDFIYSGRITISLENVSEILRLADYLCIKKLITFCSELLLSNIGEKTCMNIRQLAERYCLENVSVELQKYISPRISSLLKRSEICELPVDFIKNILQDKYLNYITEQELVRFILVWVNYDIKGRLKYLSELFDLLVMDYLPCSYIRNVILKDNLLANIMEGDRLQIIEDRLAETESRRTVDDFILCRNRNVKVGDSVKVFCYHVFHDKWRELTQPEFNCFDGLESMTLHGSCLFFCTSHKEDMYGYMHPPKDIKNVWRSDLHSGVTRHLATPSRVRGQCRLISHINGIYIIDQYGLVEEYDYVNDRWIVNGKAGFADQAGTTLYIVPMPIDRYIYVLRVFTEGMAYEYSESSFCLHIFDTVRHSWDLLSETEASELGLEDHERLHGYTITPGQVTLKDALGQARCAFNLTTRTWLSLPACQRLTELIKDIWGSAHCMDKVYFVGRTVQGKPIFMMYDKCRDRYKTVSSPPGHLSGLVCHAMLPCGNAEASALFSEPLLLSEDRIESNLLS